MKELRTTRARMMLDGQLAAYGLVSKSHAVSSVPKRLAQPSLGDLCLGHQYLPERRSAPRGSLGPK